ncbi:MAG: hypothetical protein IJR90_07140 [Clostridia bacterium]|nr:hypothetical protein [Clostridia bacterium]
MERSVPAVRYFAAANSGRGFVSYFEGIFEKIDRLYIIKGGSGTGKSRMMADVAAAAEERSYRVERYYCSADASSLDGVLIPELSVGVIDGTAPHTRDPRYPGAVDEILNVGQFWDTDKLRSKAGEIRRTIDAKSEAFGKAFSALSAAYETGRLIDRIRSETLLREKLERAAERISRGWSRGGGASESVRMLDALTMRGPASFNTFAEQADVLYLVAGKRGAASEFLRAVSLAAKEKGHPVLRAPDLLDPSKTAELFLPEERAAFVRDCGERLPDRVINTDRFIDRGAAGERRKTISSLTRERDALIDIASGFLGEAAKLHFSLEEIYSGAMDFYAKERMTAELIRKIF